MFFYISNHDNIINSFYLSIFIKLVSTEILTEEFGLVNHQKEIFVLSRLNRPFLSQLTQELDFGFSRKVKNR